MLVDSHSHLFLEEFADDLPQVMQRAREAGVIFPHLIFADSLYANLIIKGSDCRNLLFRRKGFCRKPIIQF